MGEPPKIKVGHWIVIGDTVSSKIDGYVFAVNSACEISAYEWKVIWHQLAGIKALLIGIVSLKALPH